MYDLAPRRILLFLSGIVFLAACDSRPAADPPIGDAFTGPHTLNLRKEIAGRSPTVATVSHGDHLDILEFRRRFVRVRTVEGIEGWTDSNLLLNSSDMADLAELSESAAALPSQGAASVFDALNVHPEPSRQSPSYFQIPEEGTVEVIGHAIRPRVQPNPRAPVQPPKRKDTARKSAKKPAPLPLLPPPSPPAPPPQWALARPRAYDLPGYTPPIAPPPPPMDDWSLVRTSEGKAGWVLSRMLFMNVPDEVAQYAEGHRITAYMPLGEVKDGDQVKKTWLWTTASPGVPLPFEFDSFRVFVWSTRRHRYETGYVERNVKGFYPVQAVAIPGQPDKGFAIIAEDKDGIRYRRTYAFTGYRVRLFSKDPYHDLQEDPRETGSPNQTRPAPQTWWTKLTALPRRWFAR